MFIFQYIPITHTEQAFTISNVSSGSLVASSLSPEFYTGASDDNSVSIEDLPTPLLRHRRSAAGTSSTVYNSENKVK